LNPFVNSLQLLHSKLGVAHILLDVLQSKLGALNLLLGRRVDHQHGLQHVGECVGQTSASWRRSMQQHLFQAQVGLNSNTTRNNAVIAVCSTRDGLWDRTPKSCVILPRVMC
jgi:hypothetical protein